MDSAVVLVILGGLLTLAVGLFITGRNPEEGRARGLEAMAGRIGLEFQRQGSHRVLEQLERFPRFAGAEAAGVRNYLHGAADRLDVSLADCHLWQRGAADASALSRQTVLCLASPGLDLPRFAVTGEGLSRRRLAPLDEAFGRALTSDLLAYCGEHRGLCVEGESDCLLLYRPNQAVQPERVRDFLAEGFDVLALFARRAG
jgi:hypothetical protein